MQSAFLGCEAGRDGSSLLTLVNTYIFMNNIVNLLFGGTNMIFLGPSKHCSFSRSLCVCQEMDSNRSKCTTTPFLIISSLKPTSKITGKLKKKNKTHKPGKSLVVQWSGLRIFTVRARFNR